MGKIKNFFKKISDKFAHTFNFDAYQKGLRRQYEERILEEYGMSLEEYFAAHPEAVKEYNELAYSKLDKWWNKKKAQVSEAWDNLVNNEHVQAAIENVTGERDTKENERNRIFQSNEAEIARAWEEEQAKAAREWDSIGSQMERAVGAGVNPISIAMQNGGINSSATTTIPSAPSIPAGSASLMHSGLPDLAATVFQGIGTFAEQRLKESQSDDIVAMRQYNIAEKIANTDHLKELCKGVGLTNTAQEIQNRWLDRFQQAEYDNMMKDLGVKEQNIRESESRVKLNLQEVDSVRENLRMNIERFNATLPLELQLSKQEIELRKGQVREVYEEIVLRHLQSIEQKSRNVQAAAEAESAETAASLAKATLEDAISAFHNDMVKGAAEAGISINDYMYYNTNYNGFFDWMGKSQRAIGDTFNPRGRRRAKEFSDFKQNVIQIPE